MSGETSNGSPERRRPPSTRRSYLKAVGAALASAALAGCGGSPSPTDPSDLPGSRQKGEIPHADDYDAVVDVAEAGVDATGRRPINRTLNALVDDDTLLYFSEGAYLIDAPWVLRGRNVGMVGDGATLRMPPGTVGLWIAADGVSSFRFDGFALDNTPPRTAGRVQVVCDGGWNVVRDVVVAGRQDVAEVTTRAFSLKVSGAGTHLSLSNVDMSAGAVNGTAVFVNPTSNPGSLAFRDCRVVDWGNQGLYASAHGGPLRIVGGEYANNGLSQIRVGGGDADTRAIVRDATVRVDDPRPGTANMRGIWLKEGDGTLVENCDVRITDLTGTTSSGGIVVGGEHGRTTVRDTTVRIDAPTYGVKVRRPKAGDFYAPSLTRRPGAWDVTLEDVRVVGDATGSAAIELIGRGESAFRNVEIRQRGRDRDGIAVSDSLETTVTGLAAETGRYPLLVGVRSRQDACAVTLKAVEKLSTDHEVRELRPFLPGASPPFCLDSDLLGDWDGAAALAITGVTEYGLEGEVVYEDPRDAEPTRGRAAANGERGGPES
ncbi:right-handed parallel beta-helix repeat-containing protein [Halegenticoccus tardaugens]|uniref:right-handed parallel beta-helix repeat-containing protein n=1 Tax=Halegenticoccus tardaugens TaxID=2071624 RepID=UPI00100C0461|nr:right-handed parallel beta-helix repeat-containing protein [Halegenticoccus tardaugens]